VGCVANCAGWPSGVGLASWSLAGPESSFAVTQGLRPGLVFVVRLRRGLVLSPFASLECRRGRWSRFAVPTFRTERERWGTPHSWLFGVHVSGASV